MKHFMYMPLTGLGLYGGHRGKRWFRNRVKIFKQFVLPSLEAQTNKNFILWVSVRYQDRNDRDIENFKRFLEEKTKLEVVFTYGGICFWDDKFSDEEARDRLANALQYSMGDLINVIGECDTVLMTIQPSDDCYHSSAVEEIQKLITENEDIQGVAYQKGYVMDYTKRRVAEWNPTTNPPFYTIKFPRKTFIDFFKHLEYTGPYKSHEYIGDKLRILPLENRGFIVGTHGENISTIFNHPFTGHEYLGDNVNRILSEFGLRWVEPLRLKISLRKIIMRKLPHNWQKKLRFLLEERFLARIYNWIRS